jgi:SAM-dependent methyltransferase
VFGDNIAAVTVGAAFIGDKLGLFRAMAGAGELSAKELAVKAGLSERYVLEWLRVMATARYIDYHPGTGAFELPPEHAAVLADEDSPMFASGLFEGTLPDLWMVPKVMAAFHTGKGIPYGTYPPETFVSIERTTRTEYLTQLVQQWLPAVPGLVDRLEAGGSAADLGSGAGLASIVLAKAFPKVRAFGFEPYMPSVARATANANKAGLAERVRFATFDGIHVPGGPYVLITMNYALHHAGNPLGVLSSARKALAPEGKMLVVEYRRSTRLEEDIDTPRRMAYAYGLLECMPAAIAEGGPGYGTGIEETEMIRLAKEAGFGERTTVLKEDPLRTFLVLGA